MLTNLSSLLHFCSEGDGTLEGKILRGDYGYHIFSFDNDTTPSGFGHVGIGGTIGLYNKRDGLAVGIMLNKADSDTEPAVRTIKTVADYFGW